LFIIPTFYYVLERWAARHTAVPAPAAGTV
jgi:hypothetical protein